MKVCRLQGFLRMMMKHQELQNCQILKKKQRCKNTLILHCKLQIFTDYCHCFKHFKFGIRIASEYMIKRAQTMESYVEISNRYVFHMFSPFSDPTLKLLLFFSCKLKRCQCRQFIPLSNRICASFFFATLKCLNPV